MMSANVLPTFPSFDITDGGLTYVEFIGENPLPQGALSDFSDISFGKSGVPVSLTTGDYRGKN